MIHIKIIRSLKRVDGVVFRIAKAQDRIEDKTQKRQADAKAGGLAKVLGDIDRHNDGHDDRDEGDEHQYEPPHRSAGNLEENDHVVNRHDRRPAGLACLFKGFPKSRDDDHHEYQCDKKRNEFHEMNPEQEKRLNVPSHDCNILLSVQSNASAICMRLRDNVDVDG